MEPIDKKESNESFPSIPSNDLDEENPYKSDSLNNQIVQKSDTLILDPVKDNISDQLGLEFDYPTETKVFGKKDDIDKNLNEKYESNQPINNNDNNNRNFLDNFDKPVEINDFPNNNNNNNFGNSYNNNNFNNNFGNNNNFNNNFGNNYNKNNFNNNFGAPNNYKNYFYNF